MHQEEIAARVTILPMRQLWHCKDMEGFVNVWTMISTSICNAWVGMQEQLQKAGRLWETFVVVEAFTSDYPLLRVDHNDVTDRMETKSQRFVDMCLDDSLRYAVAYHVTHKSDVVDKFIGYKSMEGNLVEYQDQMYLHRQWRQVHEKAVCNRAPSGSIIFATANGMAE